MEFSEISWFLRNFHISGEILPFLVFWSVSSPPGELENLNIPIGITRFSACGGQGPTRILQNVIFAWFWWNFMNFAENNEISDIFVKLIDFYGFSSFGESKPLRPWFWARNTKVSWRVAGSRKSQIFMKTYEFHEISSFSWIFISFAVWWLLQHKPLRHGARDMQQPE